MENYINKYKKYDDIVKNKVPNGLEYNCLNFIICEDNIEYLYVKYIKLEEDTYINNMKSLFQKLFINILRIKTCDKIIYLENDKIKVGYYVKYIML
ncbi:unknown similar to AMEV218 [Mythimna separata entomopoxvirus 'L']|uniref:Uncharacterized protein n=1 Tax=Mythimna separata entomopoxvirus 'L' TaxID=1293572 RepID=A0A916KQE5_9POXV|nr:unknown similar to AMEV218 [Mythimna separata entomopoxvirus 'L']CCU56437.1 unknown similar to AMEV218 [Mythimna separata entomopoxvirus 'L']